MRLTWSPVSACGTLLGALLVTGAATGAPTATESQTIVTFDRARVGTMPPNFKALTSAEKEPGRWQVEKVDGTLALSQIDAGRDGYRLAVLQSAQLLDLRAGVRLRIGGAGDHAAGLAWRIKDAGTYYAARLDLKDREFGLYKFVRGNRIRLSRVDGLRLSRSAWHELSIEHEGERLRVWLNGIPVANERDNTLAEAGMIGLWMPGDSTAHFARLAFEPVKPGSH